MQISPVSQINPNFLLFVTDALHKADVITCDVQDCEQCNPATRKIVELAHYAKKSIDEWKTGVDGNQLCWSQCVADSEPEIDKITDQPYRKYEMLCLIKVSCCLRHKIFDQPGKNNTHYRIAFHVPKDKIVRIKLNATGCQPKLVYSCDGIVE